MSDSKARESTQGAQWNLYHLKTGLDAENPLG